MGNPLYVFPEYYSTEALEEIQRYGKKENIEVYRVSKYGRDKSTAFLNYYDEVILGYKCVKPKDRDNRLNKYAKSIDCLSVSCYYKLDDIKYYFNVTLKESYPQRILLKGITSMDYGLSQRSSERKPHVNDSHTDWWLYKGATPWDVFEEVQL